jgi:RimJ/RimL family protein N-acetyltransferase
LNFISGATRDGSRKRKPRGTLLCGAGQCTVRARMRARVGELRASLVSRLRKAVIGPKSALSERSTPWARNPNGKPEMLLRSTEIHIESPRLLIKPFSSNDADATFSCITPSLTRHMAWEPPASRQDFDGVWQSWIPSIEDGSDYIFTIKRRADMDFLGLAGLHRVYTESPELGIWIREDRHGHGFGREAVTLIVGWTTLQAGDRKLNIGFFLLRIHAQ